MIKEKTIYIYSLFLLVGQVFAEKGHVQKASAQDPYKPYGNAEIRAAVRKPLTLEDCIGIALAKNIAFGIANGDFAQAEASHSGEYGIFFPVINFDARKEKSDQSLIELNSDLTEDVTRDKLDNQGLSVTVEQLFPTGAQVDFTSDLSRDRNTPNVFEPSTKTRNRKFSVALKQPLLRGAWPAIVRSSIKTAEYDRQIERKELYDTRLQTIFLTKRAFYEVLLQLELIKVNQAAIQRDSTLWKASQAKVIAKLATRRDVLSAEIQLAGDRVKLIKSQTDLRNRLDDLKDVLGLPIDLRIEIAEVALDFSLQSLDEESLIQQALRSNPSIQSAEIAIQRSRVDLTVARNDRLPQLDLIASFLRSFESETELNRDKNKDGWEVAFKLSYPLFNREAAASAQVAQIGISQEQDRLVDMQRQIKVSVRTIVRSIYSIIEEIKTLERSIEAAEQKVSFATSMFNLGRASNLDITDAQEALLKNQSEYVRNLVDYRIQLALLESLTGEPITQ
jgi:outer membrane protein TolC